jgi:hypothetical protein
MLEVRNSIEAAALVLLIGYPELNWLPVKATVKVVIMVLTLLPIGILALMGISGDSLGQRLRHMVRYARRRRVIHMCRTR